MAGPGPDELAQYAVKAPPGLPPDLAQYVAKPQQKAAPDQFAQDRAVTEAWAQNHKILGPITRFLVAGGQNAASAITDTPSALYHAIVDPPTLEESSLSPEQRVIGRLGVEQGIKAGMSYARGEVSPKGAASVLPEALGAGLGQVSGGAVYGKGAEIGGQIASAAASNPTARAVATAPVRYGARAAEAAANSKLRPFMRVMTPADEAAASTIKVPGRDFGLPKSSPPSTAPVAASTPGTAPAIAANATANVPAKVGPPTLGSLLKPADVQAAANKAVGYEPPKPGVPIAHRPVPSYQGSGRPNTTVVPVDVNKLDAAWAKDQSYIAPGSQTGRMARFNQWRADNPTTAIGAPEAGLLENGNVAFDNGRNRFAALRDQGVKTVNVEVSSSQADAFKNRFGASSTLADLPPGHTAVESSAVKSYKYDPDARTLEVHPTSGTTTYRYGDVSPEQAADFQNAKSVGKAWQQVRGSGSPLIAKRVGGKWVSVKPVQPTPPTADLSDLLQQSLEHVRQRQAGK